MATQLSSKLNIVNGMPSVKKLWNGRFRLDFFCDPKDKNEGWYRANIDNWLPAFGTLQDAALENGWDYPENSGVEYDDMRLVEADVQFIPSANTHYVVLAYETLTGAFVQEKDDDTDYELNGLRRVTRPLVAMAGVDYQKVVGTSTIDHQVDTEAAVTLYLASAKIVDTDASRRVLETWIEAGTLRVTENTESEGVRKVATTFLVIEGAVVGPIIDRDTNNFEGLQTIIVTTLQDSNGNSLVEGGENLVNQVSGFSPFSYPGVLNVDIEETTNTSGGDWLKVQALLIDAPAQCKVKTTTFFIFQASNSIVQGDYTYTGSDGLWSPNHWAAFSIDAEGTFDEGLFTDSSTFRGYRTSSFGQSGNIGSPPNTLSNAQLSWQGNSVIVDNVSIDYDLVIDQGPPNPIGNTYTLDVQITPAFDDVDGNQFYKKTIIVTDIIPTQPNTASLPYT